MPATYSAKDRERILPKVIAGLRAGTPLTVICSEAGMPCDDTIRIWAEADSELGREIARAREAGFDQIALEALAIADETGNDTRKGDGGQDIPNNEWISRSRLRVETRLKLLAKWDPKRYGDLVKHAGPNGDDPVQAAVTVTFRKTDAGEH